MKPVKKFFLDTEFIETVGSIELISIGIVCEGDTYNYMINKDANLDLANDWVKENVLAKIPEYDPLTRTFRQEMDSVFSKDEITTETYDFIRELCEFDYKDPATSTPWKYTPEFWTYYGSYDWVVFCWLFGRMVDLPKEFPMFTKDLKQELERVGNPDIPFKPEGEHNALSDALWNKKVYEWLEKEYWNCNMKGEG